MHSAAVLAPHPSLRMRSAHARHPPDGAPDYLRSNFLSGVKNLPVAYTPTRSYDTVPLHRLGSAAGASATVGYGGHVERTAF